MFSESPLKFVVGLEPVSVALGSTMTLSCQLNRAAGDVLWKHNGKEIKPGGRYVIRSDKAQRLLTVSSVAQEDEGEFSCECKDDKTNAKITTKGKKCLHSLIFNSDYYFFYSTVPGTSHITCSITNIYTIAWMFILALHLYLHEVNTDIVSVIAPRLVKFLSKLNNVVANEGKDAIFKCSVTPADVSLRWLFNNVPVTSGPKFKIAHGGTSHSLTITAVTLEDVGEIGVDAEGKVCKATLQVQSKTWQQKNKQLVDQIDNSTIGVPFVLQSDYIYK